MITFVKVKQYSSFSRFLFFLACLSVVTFLAKAQVNKAPAYPLITHDPYFSVWSFSDKVNESVSKHWTGSSQSLTGFVKVDGTVYRILGDQEKVFKAVVPYSDEAA